MSGTSIEDTLYLSGTSRGLEFTGIKGFISKLRLVDIAADDKPESSLPCEAVFRNGH